MVEDLLRAYNQRFPEISRLVALGESAGGRTIWALKVSDNPDRDELEPSILLDGAHHANELLTTEYIIDAVQALLESYAEDPVIRSYVDTFEIWLVPLVNPDGRQAHMELTAEAGRKNHRDINVDGFVEAWEGVDVNRNYPFHWGTLGEVGSRSWERKYTFRGPDPGSEREAQAMMALARRERFVASISYHTNGTKLLPPYATFGLEIPENDECIAVAEWMANVLPVQPSGRRYAIGRRLYPVDGVWKDWQRAELGTLAMVIEGPLSNPKNPERRRRSVEATRATWRALLDRYLAGPVLRGVVLDAEGHPLEAEVRVTEVLPRNGERWTSRPRDGFFARYLPTPGVYNLVVDAPGYVAVRRRVDLQETPAAHLELRLEPLDAASAR
jgi:hypothetical protein